MPECCCERVKISHQRAKSSLDAMSVVGRGHIVPGVALLEVILDVLDASLVALNIAAVRVLDAAGSVSAISECVSRFTIRRKRGRKINR